MCTEINVLSTPSDYTVNNICRNKSPSGSVTQAKGTLSSPSGYPDGKFQEKFFVLAPSVDYNIFQLGKWGDEEFSVEYDCGTSFGVLTNYCVHFLSRKPTMSTELLNYLIGEVNKQGLNANNLPLQMTKQEGCVYSNDASDTSIILKSLK